MKRDLAGFLRAKAPIQDIGTYLDRLSDETRIAQCLALPGRLERVLYEAARGAFSTSMEQFVPKPEQTVIYELKNSLPVFNISQKRFYRPAEGEVVGYNHTSATVQRFAGPGYFFAVDGENGELLFDYTRQPALRPPGWPPIRSNEGFIAGQTYGEMVDYVRAVGQKTVIGAAFRHGKPMNAYFLLTRAVPST